MKKIWTYCALLAAALSACDKDLISNPDQYTRVYMPQAAEYPALRPLMMADTLQPVIIGAAYGGVDDQPREIKVKFVHDDALVDAFNKANNTNYKPMLAGSFELPAMETVIRPHAFSSEALKIKVKTVGGLASQTDYLLPVSIQEVTPGVAINEKLRTTYLAIRAEYQEFARNRWKVVAVSSQEAPNTGDKAWDGVVSTSWHTQWKAAKPAHPHRLTVDMDTTLTVHGFYTLPVNVATGNPQQIQLELSTDGATWTDAGQFTFLNTYDKQYAYLAQPATARYFRLTVLSSFAATHFTHVGEWGAF